MIFFLEVRFLFLTEALQILVVETQMRFELVLEANSIFPEDLQPSLR